MKRLNTRRRVLAAGGAVTLALIMRTGTAQPMEVQGSVGYAGGAVIPAGNLDIYLEDRSIRDRTLRRVAETRVRSNGHSASMDFALPLSGSVTSSPGLQIVARLERSDGWLVARGSATFDGSPVFVILKTTVY